MNRFTIWTLLTCAVGMAACLAPVGAMAEVPADMVARIEAAAPATATVAPQAPRKVLVFTGCGEGGFYHSSIPVAAKAMEILGAKTGAYEATVTDDPAAFNPESLNAFDAVIMDNNTGAPFTDPAVRQNFLDFVRNGKGLVGIHAATDCFYDWAEYGEMIGGYFDGHPWTADGTVAVKIDDPAHPVNAAFNGQGFTISDEIYQFRDPYSRDKLRILLSLDTAQTDMTKKGINRTDGDFAISWVSRQGDGRVFYCSLGHREDIFWNPAVLKHYLDGIQFALGDLEADATPSGALSPEQIEASRREAEKNALEKLSADIAGYDYGEGAEAFDALQSLALTADTPERRKAAADKFAALLNADATLNAKQFAAEMLSIIGGDDQVPALAAALAKDETFEPARYALQRIPTTAAGDALRAALASATPERKVALANALGARAEPASTEALTPLASDADPAVARAALAALARVGTPEAVMVLVDAKSKAPEGLQPTVSQACLRGAERLLEQGDTKNSANIFTMLYAPTESRAIRIGAFNGLVAALGDRAAPFVVQVLQGEDGEIQKAALQAAAEVSGADATAALAEALPRLDPALQAGLVHALAVRGDAAARPAVTQAASNPDPAVRTAALSALAVLGDASSVMLLAESAAGEDRAASEAARNSLDRLAGAGVNEKLLECLQSDAAPAVRAQCARSLAARRVPEAASALLDAARQPDETLRAAAVKAAGVLAGREHMPALVTLLVEAPEGDFRTEVENALVATAARVEEPGARTADILAALNAASGDAARTTPLVRVLGRIGDDSALDALRAALASPDPAIRDAAIQALSDWPTPAPLADLLGFAQQTQDEAVRNRALRGYFRLLALPSDRAPSDTLARYEEGLALATRPEEVKLALSGLGDVRDLRVAEVLERYLADPQYQAEAKAAIERLAQVSTQATASDNPGEAGNALDGKPETRWSTGTGQTPGQWFQLDLGWEQPVAGVTLDTTPSPGDYPRGYEVYVSNDPNNWGEPVATGAGAEGQPVTVITFAPKSGRYVRIVQTGTVDGLWWSIHEVTVQ